ncbi:MAG: hypothetical protein HZB53_01715 [Chloroflexi bacterium]|nr:hypothetical protein [Chloroflexota bacterium]
MTTRWTKTDWLLLLGVVAVAAVFRLWRLEQTPPGFQFDEAYNAADALRILGGERPLFFEANGGREALYVYLIAPFIAMLGVATPFALHLASALVGIASVALCYVLWRHVMPDDERTVAALAALFMAVSYWHIHFSRYGIRAILMPLALTAIVLSLWAATRPGARREWVIARAAKNWHALPGAPLSALLACGVLLGLSIYAHPAARFIPVIVVFWYAWTWWLGADSPLKHFAPDRAWPLLRDLLIIAVVSLVVFLPLGIYFLQNPDAFVGHPTVVAITDQRVAGGSVLGALASNALAVAGMFFVRGDAAWIHNLAGRPVFDAAAAVFFVLGLVEWVVRLRAKQPAAILLAIWLPVMLVPTLLSDGAPNFSRAIGTLPALFVLPAWGALQAFYLLRHLSRRLLPLRAAGRLAGAACALALLLGTVATYHDYFDVFPARPELYVAYDVDKLDAARQLVAQSAANRVFTPPLLSQHATFELLTRNARLKSFDNGEVMVLPARGAQKGMLYAFPSDADPAYMDEFERTYGVLAQKQIVPGSNGAPLLVEYVIAPAAIPADAGGLPSALPVTPKRLLNADFEGEIRLVGYRVADSPDRQKPFQLTLVWQALKPVSRDYTLFIHLNDANGKRVSQRDRRPGNGSYPTTVWSPGDIVIETYEVWPESVRGSLQFALGWYDRVDGARARVLDAAGRPLADNVTFAAEGTP